ncbi:MAG: YitT family protein [Ruminococcaceae bacterium]|nr:YitT family protein [Oscillospiraceae bacterium]
MKNKVLTILKEYSVITFGIFLVAVGAYFFKFPSNISTGGVTGLAVVLNQAFPVLTASNYVTIFNTVFLVMGFIVLGKDFGIKTAYGSIMLTVFLELFDLFPLPFALPLTNEPVLELFFAVLLPGLGSAILFFYHGSSGGTDIVAMIIRKYINMDCGTALLLADTVLVLLTFYDFNTHSAAYLTGLLSIAGLITKTLVVDSAIDSINRSKHFVVVTTHREEVERFITETLRRSATTWECEGAYSHNKEYAMISVMNRSQANRLRNYLKKIDPNSFVIVTNTSDIIGKGFKQV